jgi:hypothetical protein
VLRRADAGHVGAGGGEDGQEARRVLAVVGLAGRAGTRVARREDDGDAAGAELAEHLADFLDVRAGHGLLVLAVRGCQGLGKGRVGLLEEVGEEVQVGLVGGFVCDGLIEIRDERTAATGAVVDYGRLVCDGDGVLDIEIGFDIVVLSVGLVVTAAVDLDDGKVGVGGVRGVDGLEELELVVLGVFLGWLVVCFNRR